MDSTLHYSLLAAHTLFQKVFLCRLNKKYPSLLPGQPKVIDFLMYHHRAFQREIADGCMIEPATLSLILEKMEKAQLIKREKSANNKKNILVTLTPEGVTAGIYMQDLFKEVEVDICAGLSAEAQADLLFALQQIRKNEKEMLS